MSKFNFQGANISAKKIHFGDNYNYLTPHDFLTKNLKSYTETEQELVEIIYANTSSEEERRQILESLKAIRDESRSDSEKKRSILNFKPLISILRTKGIQVAIDLFKKYLEEKISSFDFNKIGL